MLDPVGQTAAPELPDTSRPAEELQVQMRPAVAPLVDMGAADAGQGLDRGSQRHEEHPQLGSQGRGQVAEVVVLQRHEHQPHREHR